MTLSARVLSQPPFAQNTCAILLMHLASEYSAKATSASDSNLLKYFLAFRSIPDKSQQLDLARIPFAATYSDTSLRIPIHIGDVYGLLFISRIYLVSKPGTPTKSVSNSTG